MNDKPSGCRECPLYSKGRGFVLGSGDPITAKIMLCFEAPGKDEVEFPLAPHPMRDFLKTDYEVRSEIAIRMRDYPDLPHKFLRVGAPIVGKTGALTTTWLLPAAGLKREGLFIDNVLRCLPPKNGDSQYPKGDERKEAERCCRQYDRFDKFRPDVLIATLNPAALMREITPLPLVIKDIEKTRDFAAQGRRPVLCLGGKSAKAFLRHSENVTKIRGDYVNLEPLWTETYKNTFLHEKKQKKQKALVTRPETLDAAPCKRHKRYKGANPPKCGCVPCWETYETRRGVLREV